MIVSQEDFFEVLQKLAKEPCLGLDTETTGLRMFHGDKLFSIILADRWDAYYFNFNYAPDHLGGVAPLEQTLPPGWLTHFHPLFDDLTKTWFIQNAANFDCQILGRELLSLAGTIHCTKAIARVERNDRQSYSLADLLPIIGLEKSEAVEEYVAKHKLYTVVRPPGKAQSVKYMHYEQVPFGIMAPYGEKDGTGVFHLGMSQINKITQMDVSQPELTASGRSLTNVMENERRLVKTIARMKNTGVQIDLRYVERAAAYELERQQKHIKEFKDLTGRDFKDSGKLFQEVFIDEKDKWGKTAKGNPSFDADVLANFTSPAAVAVCSMRDAKAKADFYNGFTYHADDKGVVHPDFNAEGTVHGRLSSSNPNFQNLTKEDDEAEIAGEFIVRRAIVPRQGFVLIMPDYEQMEYKFALECACRMAGHMTPLAELIRAGYDFHEATGKRVKDVTGLELPRKTLKIANFLTLYGGGVGKLAAALKISYPQARIIRQAIKDAAPEINNLIQGVMGNAEESKFITNWFGRRSHFIYRGYAYRAPNYLISGGCADIVKIAMNRIDEYLLDKQSRMVMTVHDELPIEVHLNELNTVPKEVNRIMEQVFVSKYVPLTTSMEWSEISLGDKKKGYPV